MMYKKIIKNIKKFRNKNIICHIMTNKYIVWFDEIGLDDVALVGGKMQV